MKYLFILLFLTGCTVETCEDKGKKTVFVGFMTVPIYVGNIIVFNQIPLYECRDNETR